MLKQLAVLSLFIAIVLVPTAKARTLKASKKSKTSTQQIKPSKHTRKSRRFKHRGTGPDLKTITTESPYTEDPSNGVTPIETKQPGL